LELPKATVNNQPHATVTPKHSTKSAIAQLKTRSDESYLRILEVLGEQQFLLGSHTETRLNRSLAIHGRNDLRTTTLLTPTVHTRHELQLAERFIEQFRKIKRERLTEWHSIPAEFRAGTNDPSDHEIAAEHVRFFTLIDGVTPVSSTAAVQAAKKMKENLATAIKSVRGVWCRGAVEVEVINPRLMRSIRALKDSAASEQRKLEVCEILAEELKGTLYQNEENLMLVHFHGVLTAKRSNDFDNLRSQLRANARWKRAARQIEIKQLSEEFGGKPKQIEKNLQHIARYITKGGNDWVGNAIALRYKLGFSQYEDFHDETEYVQRYWRRDKDLKAERKHEGIDDTWSLTANEIAELAITIDLLMGLNRSRTGYLLAVGK